MNDLKNIVFDIGNVLLNWDPRGLYKAIFGKDEFEEHPLMKIIGSNLWLEMDRGTAGIEETIGKLEPYYPDFIDEIGRFIREVASHIKPMEDSFKVARECKERGMSVYLLSNFGEEAYKVIRNRIEDFDIFDGGVISWEVKLLKPDARIYEYLLSKYDLTPSQTLFIDDLAPNIEAAEKLGIKGLHLPVGTDLRCAFEALTVKSH
ncbi:MAG: HAD family phosphatase [Spirochaetales bacterium]|nr:HAD family phosphatase [Spirochaetales bacterium]